MSNILIIDDEEPLCEILATAFSRMGHAVSYQLTLKDGLKKIFNDTIDIVLLDVHLPDGNGLEAIKIIKQHPLAPEIIIITGNEDIDGAELAMKSKAWDYIPKTGSHKKFKFALDRALEYRKQKQSIPTQKTIKRDSIIGKSRLIQDCLDKIAKASKNDLPVMITGETGTGKELFSRAIHTNSNRSQAGFVVVDCAALPKHLVESLLFGHTKGSFTGADSDKVGLMKMADKGTLFLDEVGELPLSIQKKFLRSIQEKRFRPVGSKNEVESDFRLICATHRDLKELVKENKFREDLYFRIFSLNIHLPPLKDRKEDIKLLVQAHLSRNYALSKENFFTASEEFFEELQSYEWPGNIRELINTIDLVCSEAGGEGTLFAHHLPGHIRAFHIRNKFNPSKTYSPEAKNIGTHVNFKDYIEKVKYEYLKDLLSTSKGNITESCKQSGLSRSQLYRLMQQYDLKSS